MKQLFPLLCLYLVAATASAVAAQPATSDSVVDTPCVDVPLYGNAYLTAGEARDLRIDGEGLRGWSDRAQVVSVYFAVAEPGDLALALVGRNDGSPAAIEACVGGKTFGIDVRNAATAAIPVGTVSIERPGYVRVDLRGVACRSHFGTYEALRLSGPAAAGGVTAIPGGEAAGDWPYWGRRGPSVHMGYSAPAGRRSATSTTR